MKRNEDRLDKDRTLWAVFFVACGTGAKPTSDYFNPSEACGNANQGEFNGCVIFFPNQMNCIVEKLDVICDGKGYTNSNTIIGPVGNYNRVFIQDEFSCYGEK